MNSAAAAATHAPPPFSAPRAAFHAYHHVWHGENAHTFLNASKYDFGTPECVMQPLRSVCPALANAKAHGERHHQICVPVEPVIPTEQLRDDPRHVTSKSRLHRQVRALNPRQFVYKQDALKCMNQSAFRRRVYLDVGANEYYTSIGFWFLQD